MKCWVKSVVVCVFVVQQVQSMEQQHVYMKHSEMEDQATSASGYAYQLHSGGPLKYVTYPGEGVNQIGYAPQPVLGPGQELSLQEYQPQQQQQQQINAYGVQGLYKPQGIGLGGVQGIGLQTGFQGQQVYAPQPQYQVQQYR